MDKSGETSELLSPSKAAALIYVHPETLRRYETKGLIKSFRTAGGHRRYKEEDLHKLKKALEENPTDNKEHLVVTALKELGVTSSIPKLKTVKEIFPEAYGHLAHSYVVPIEIGDNRFSLIVELDDSDVIFHRFFYPDGWPADFEFFKGNLSLQKTLSLPLFINSEIKSEQELRGLLKQRTRSRAIVTCLFAFLLYLGIVRIFQIMSSLSISEIILAFFSVSVYLLLMPIIMKFIAKESWKKTWDMYKVLPVIPIIFLNACKGKILDTKDLFSKSKETDTNINITSFDKDKINAFYWHLRRKPKILSQKV